MQILINRHVRVSALALCGIVLILATDIFAQVKREHLYKLRGRDRFEGIRTKNWKPVSGEIKLASLVFAEKGWSEAADGAASDEVAIHFYSTLTADVAIEVFNLDMQYFMLPRLKTFSKNWNEFSWPASILNEVKLPVNKLSGVVNGQKGKVYFPLCFKKPSAISEGASLKALLIPDKDMTVDLALYAGTSTTPLKKWDAQKMKSDHAFALDIPASVLKMGESYLLKATEKGGREFSYSIRMFGE